MSESVNLDFRDIQSFYLEVNKGNIEGHSMVAVVGSNSSVGTTFTDIWSGGGDMVYQTGGETWAQSQ